MVQKEVADRIASGPNIVVGTVGVVPGSRAG